MSEQAESPGAGLVDGIKKNAGLTVVIGIITLIAGTLAIMSPFVAGVSITILVGATLAISGVSQCFLAFKTGALGRGLMVFVVGVLMTIVGVYMMNQPVAGLTFSSGASLLIFATAISGNTVYSLKVDVPM